MDLRNDMDQTMHQHYLDEFDNFRDHRYLPDVVYLAVLQNLDELNPDVVPTFQDVHLVHPQDVAADVELRHLLRMDYFQVVVGAERLALFHQQLKMDCCRDVVQQVCFLQLAFHHLNL